MVSTSSASQFDFRSVSETPRIILSAGIPTAIRDRVAGDLSANQFVFTYRPACSRCIHKDIEGVTYDSLFDVTRFQVVFPAMIGRSGLYSIGFIDSTGSFCLTRYGSYFVDGDYMPNCMLTSESFKHTYTFHTGPFEIFGDVNDTLDGFLTSTVDTSPEIGVGVEDGATLTSVVISDPNNLIDGASLPLTQGADVNGATNWTDPSDTLLPEGEYLVTASGIDANGSPITAEFVLTIVPSGLYEVPYSPLYE